MSCMAVQPEKNASVLSHWPYGTRWGKLLLVRTRCCVQILPPPGNVYLFLCTSPCCVMMSAFKRDLICSNRSMYDGATVYDGACPRILCSAMAPSSGAQVVTLDRALPWSWSMTYIAETQHAYCWGLAEQIQIQYISEKQFPDPFLSLRVYYQLWRP